MHNRRRICASIVLLATSPWSLAEGDYPSKPIELVVPFAPGGASDLVGRIVAAGLSRELATPVVVVNRTGAGGTIGMKSVVRAAADGYTIGIGGSSNLTIAPNLMKPVPYDAQRDLTPLAIAATGPFILVVAPRTRAATLQELVDMARLRPSALNYGTSGVGSTHHVMTEYFNYCAGIKTTHIPFKGGAENVSNLLSGNIDFMFEASSSILSLVQAGKIRALAVSGPRRLAQLPDVPTVMEAGIPHFSVESVIGVVAPSGLKPAVLARLSGALDKVLTMPLVREAIEKTGSDAGTGSAREFAELIKTESARWRKTIADAAIEGG